VSLAAQFARSGVIVGELENSVHRAIARRPLERLIVVFIPERINAGYRKTQVTQEEPKTQFYNYTEKLIKIQRQKYRTVLPRSTGKTAPLI
jgi:hypothetical protein